MAFNNWGAWVFKNGERRKDRECVIPFVDRYVPDEVWQRVWHNAMTKNEDKKQQWEQIHHAVLGDDEIRIGIYKDWCDLYVKAEDKIKITQLIKEEWRLFDGCVCSEWDKGVCVREVYAKKYFKRKLGIRCLRWRWLIHPNRFFLWIDPFSKLAFLRNWIWVKPCRDHVPRMEVTLKQGNDIWYAYAGLDTGSTHKGDNIPKMVRKKALLCQIE